MASDYREILLSGRAGSVVACVWERVSTPGHTQLVVPDGCVDLIWLGGDLVVAGADTGPRLVDLPTAVRATGVRLRPGSAGAALGVHAAELRDLQVDASDVWGQSGVRLQESVAAAAPVRRRALLLDAVLTPEVTPDALVAASVRKLARARARVATVAAELGVSERQLHRRTLAAVGYGPKMLARVSRLRRLVALDGEDLASRAIAAGYAGQAHMNEDVRRLTGTTPVRFLKDARTTAA